MSRVKNEHKHSGQLNIFLEPSVYLVGKQTTGDSEINEFLSDHNVSQWTTDTEVSGEKLCEVAGRLCYMSFAKPRPGGNSSYLNHIKEVGHGSVTEHAVFNFIITNVSRSFTHELVRHRAGFGYSQLSQRYVDESSAEYVVPACIKDDDELYNLWLECISKSHQCYIKLSDRLSEKYENIENKTLRRKMARQAARSVLPNATETKIFVTANARSLRHFIEMRCNEHADSEIRLVAQKMLELLKNESPNLFGDYEFVNLDDGTKAARTNFSKI